MSPTFIIIDTCMNPVECQRLKDFVLSIMLIASADTDIGSRIKRHTRQKGVRKMREQHRRYCPVWMINEYGSSKNCFYVSIVISNYLTKIYQ